MTPQEEIERSGLYETTLEVVHGSSLLANLIGAPLVVQDRIRGGIWALKSDGGEDEAGASNQLAEMYLRTMIKMAGTDADPDPIIASLSQFAHFVVPVSGPAGLADINVFAAKTAQEEPWALYWVRAVVGERKEEHDLLAQCSDSLKSF